MNTINTWVYTIKLYSDKIVPLYKLIRRECKGYDLPMYLPLESGDVRKQSGSEYLIATPEHFKPERMEELLNKFSEKANCSQYYKETFPIEHFNHNYEVSIKHALGINLGKYCLSKVIPIYYGLDKTLQDTEEYKAMFDDLN